MGKVLFYTKLLISNIRKNKRYIARHNVVSTFQKSFPKKLKLQVNRLFFSNFFINFGHYHLIYSRINRTQRTKSPIKETHKVPNHASNFIYIYFYLPFLDRSINICIIYFSFLHQHATFLLT